MTTPTLPTIKFPWRAAIYGIVILYLGGDIYLFHGPLSRMIDRMRGEGIEEQVAKVPTGLVATVNTWPITVADLERGVWEYCTVRGLESSDLAEKRMGVIRSIVLGELIDDLAVWHFSRLNPVEVNESQVDAAVAQVRGHFDSDASFAEHLAGQGMDAGAFRRHIADQVHQRQWLEAKAAKFVSVSDDEARAWYEADEDARQVPERWRARQVFMPVLDRDPAVVGEAMAAVARGLAAGEMTFEEAVAKHSEDGRSKAAGGDLGYFSAARMPGDFVAAVAAQEIGTPGAPIRTELGWHLVEVTGHLPQGEASFEELREEIRALLESEKRQNVIDQIVADLRQRSKIWPSRPKPQAIFGQRQP